MEAVNGSIWALSLWIQFPSPCLRKGKKEEDAKEQVVQQEKEKENSLNSVNADQVNTPVWTKEQLKEGMLDH